MYSQNDEEQVIEEALKIHKLDAKGSVIDIGANDGETFSNSLKLIERGWTALLIEPSPKSFQKLMKKHAGNPNVTLLNAAIGLEERIVKFYDCEENLSSTTVEKEKEKWEASGCKYRDYYVPQVTMRRVLEQLGGGANVLSVDTEGTSLDIVRSCPIGSWCPAVIIIEHDHRTEEIAAWAKVNGYRVCDLNGENIILIRIPGR